VNIISKIGLGSVLALSLGACGSETSNREPETAEAEVYDAPPVEATPVDAPPAVEESPSEQGSAATESETRSAAESIAEARCAREQRCDNVGADKKFSSQQDCMDTIRNDWREELNALECPGGVDQAQLNECMAEIRAEECSSPFDTLSRVAACGAGQICVD
jgi:hypothetical protein